MQSDSTRRKSRRKNSRTGSGLNGNYGRKALIFARQQLLEEMAKKDCNVLLCEGYVNHFRRVVDDHNLTSSICIIMSYSWHLTVLRRGKQYRIEVQYKGRGALARGKPTMTHRQPPFIELLGPA